MAPAAVPTPVAASQSKGDIFSELMSGLGGMGGAVGTNPTPKISKPPPMGSITQVMTPIADTSARDQLAQQMQQRIAALNSGKLFG